MPNDPHGAQSIPGGPATMGHDPRGLYDKACSGYDDPDALPHPRDPEVVALLLREQRPGEGLAQTARRLFGVLARALPQDVVDHMAAEAWAERRDDDSD